MVSASGWTLDDVTTAPTLTGEHGRAWALDLDARFAGCNASRRGAAVGIWIVEAPFAHPAWHSYAISFIHLRPVEGLPTPIFYLPNASHELWVQAIDPEQSRQLTIVGGSFALLQPMNYAGQFYAGGDLIAARRVRSAVQMVCSGMLSPDTDFKRDWCDLFGDNMLNDRRGTRAGHGGG